MRSASLTRRVRFRATHRYYKPEWSEARNREVFGSCAAPEPHGHDYVCDVTVRGPIDSVTGMVLDLGVLDELLARLVVRPLDGRLINEALPEFGAGKLIPTCEEVARLLGQRIDLELAKAERSARVATVRLAEDDSLSATWAAEG